MTNDKSAEEIVRGRIDAIKARCEAATPGPWYADGWATWDDAAEEFAELHDTSADAQFISHAREDIPYLLARVAELEGQLVEKAEEAEMYRILRADADRIREGMMQNEMRLISDKMRLEAQLSASQQETRAAVEDLDALINLVCDAGSGDACHLCADNGEDCHGDDPRWHCDDIPGRQWRGPQEAGEERK